MVWSTCESCRPQVQICVGVWQMAHPSSARLPVHSPVDKALPSQRSTCSHELATIRWQRWQVPPPLSMNTSALPDLSSLRVLFAKARQITQP